MNTLARRLDLFVRWFFNSSPTADLIEPTSGQNPSLDDRTNRINA